MTTDTLAAVFLFDLACLVVVGVWAWRETRKGQPAERSDDWGRPVIGLGEPRPGPHLHFERDTLTPIHDALAAQTLRAELDDEAAVARWLS